jgi:anionic cell wall polymer biosynthesis LytR-Cps2A-Psr (LCP) family protein
MCSVVESYVELGSVEEINTMCNIVESYAELGSIDEIKSVFTIMESYSDLGSPDEINTAFDLVEEYVETSKTKSANEGADQLASTYGLPFETVKPLVEKMGKEDAIKTIEAMNESNNVTNRYRKDKSPEQSAIIESTPIEGNRISRLFESHLR